VKTSVSSPQEVMRNFLSDIRDPSFPGARADSGIAIIAEWATRAPCRAHIHSTWTHLLLVGWFPGPLHTYGHMQNYISFAYVGVELTNYVLVLVSVRTGVAVVTRKSRETARRSHPVLISNSSHANRRPPLHP
jgi:hypothetical protein